MRREKKLKIQKPLWNTLSNMVDIRKIMYQRNFAETIEDSDGTFCLNEKHIEDGSDHKNLQVTTVKYPSGYRKKQIWTRRCTKKQPNIIFIRKETDTKSNHGL